MKAATYFMFASMAVFGAMADPLPSQMGVEVLNGEDGQLLMVREVAHSLDKRCTNCVHVGGKCKIGEGNCYSTENALCTGCPNKGAICVDQDGGSCKYP